LNIDGTKSGELNPGDVKLSVSEQVTESEQVAEPIEVILPITEGVSWNQNVQINIDANQFTIYNGEEFDIQLGPSAIRGNNVSLGLKDTSGNSGVEIEVN